MLAVTAALSAALQTQPLSPYPEDYQPLESPCGAPSRGQSQAQAIKVNHYPRER